MRRPGSLLLKGVTFAALLALLLVIGFRAASLLRESHLAQDIAPKGGHFVKADGLNIFVQEKGPVDGPVVLFIGGTMAWSEVWRDTLDPVSNAGFHTVAIDLPPFGFSERPGANGYGPVAQGNRIVGVMDALGIQKATLVGHSFGGGATVEAALRNAPRINSLVLVDAALGLNAKEGEPGIVDWLLARDFLRNAVVALTFTNPPVLDYGVKINFADRSKVLERHLVTFRSALEVTGTTEAVGNWLIHGLMAVPHDAIFMEKTNYSWFQPPVLLVWGRDDTTTPLAQGEEIAQLFPNSELTVFDGNNHVPHLEVTAPFNDRLIKFLRDHAAP